MKTKIPGIITYLMFMLIIIPAFFAFADENTLRLLVWEGYTPDAYIHQFEEEIKSKYGIPLKMDISYALSDDDFFNLARDKKIDIITVSHYSIKDRPEDLLGMSLAMAWGDSLAPLKRIGEKWKIAHPAEGTMWWIDEYAITWALADKPLLKKIAEEWINKSLSSDFQMNHIKGELRAYPVVTHFKKKGLAKGKTAFEINPTADLSHSKRIVQHTYSQRDTNGLKLMWNKAMEGVSTKRKEQ